MNEGAKNTLAGKALEAEEKEEEGPLINMVGCTSNVVYIDKIQKKIFVANAGDSRCVMAKAGKVIEMSIDHTPFMEQEVARITKAGSKIVRGRVDGGLNLTRSLGDFKYK